MAVEAIGTALSGGTTSDVTQRAGLRQEDFIRLFVAQLSFQDPLEPVDNREFLAQLAQFAGLEQARVTGEGVSNLVAIESVGQSVGILGKQVAIVSETGEVNGTVTAVAFDGGGPTLTVQTAAGAAVTDLRLSQIRLIRP